MKHENFFKSSISKDEINTLPLNHFKGRIHLIENISQLASIGNNLKSHSILGFDTETRPTFRKGRLNKVALLQLATSDEAFLIRINKTGLTDLLLSVFQDENITKVGLAIKDDLNSLQRYDRFEPEGFIDLQQFVKQYSIEDNGLKKLTANILGFRISKRQQTSNWEKEVLDDDQLTYAATDAWVCLEIYKKLLDHYDK